jgi:hypothetical protein
MTKTSEYDIFICHETSDKEFVIYLADELESMGVKPWYYEKCGELPISFHEEELLAIKKTAAFLHVVSPQSLKNSHECHVEVVAAFDAKKRIIPLLKNITIDEVKKDEVGSVWFFKWAGTRALDGNQPINKLSELIAKTLDIDKNQDFDQQDGVSQDLVEEQKSILEKNGITFTLKAVISQDSNSNRADDDILLETTISTHKTGNSQVLTVPCDTVFLIDREFALSDDCRKDQLVEAVNGYLDYFKNVSSKNRVCFLDFNESSDIKTSLGKVSELIGKGDTLITGNSKRQLFCKLSNNTLNIIPGLTKTKELFQESKKEPRRVKRLYLLVNSGINTTNLKEAIRTLSEENIGIYFIVWGISSVPKIIKPIIDACPDSMIIPVANERDIIEIMRDLARKDSSIVLQDCSVEMELPTGSVGDFLYCSYPNERNLGKIYNHKIVVFAGSFESDSSWKYISLIGLPESRGEVIGLGRITIKGRDASDTKIILTLDPEYTRKSQRLKNIVMVHSFESLQWFQSLDDPERLARSLKSRKIIADQRKVDRPFLTALDHFIAAAEKPANQQEISRKDEMYLFSDFIIAPYRMKGK